MERTCRQIIQDPIRPVYPDGRTDQVCELLLGAEEPDWPYTSLCSTGSQARLAYELHQSVQHPAAGSLRQDGSASQRCFGSTAK